MGDPVVTPAGNVFDDAGERAKARAMADLLRLGFGTLAAGAGARGVLGLADLAGSPSPTEGPVLHRRTVVPIPYLASEKKPKVIKRAEIKADPGPGGPVEDFARKLVSGLGITGDHTGLVSGALVPSGKSSLGDMPWAVASALPIAAGGLYAGWKGMDKALGYTERRELSADLEQAQARYRKALIGQYGVKASALNDDPIGRVYDRMPKGLEKSANATDKYIGAVLALGTLSALGTGKLTYDHTINNRPQPALQSAIRARRAQLEAASPAPTVAVPVAVDADGNTIDERVLKAMTE